MIFKSTRSASEALNLFNLITFYFINLKSSI